MIPRDPPRPSNQDGIVLISVLWIVVILSLLISTFGASVRTAVAINQTERALAQVDALSDAGIELAVSGLLAPPASRWRADGRAYETRFGGARLGLRVFDANGFLDINYANRETLLAVLEGATNAKGVARNVHDFIMQRRDAIQAPPDAPRGPDTAASRASEKLHNPVAFQDLSELLSAPGMSPALLSRLERVLTVHSGGKGINLSTAPIELLRLLPEMSSQQIDQIIAARETPTAAESIANIVSSSQTTFTRDAGPAYKITVAVAGKGFAKPIKASATILINKAANAPYFGLAWRPVGE